MRFFENRSSIFLLTGMAAATMFWSSTPSAAQEDGTSAGPSIAGPSIASVSINKMSPQQRTFICGGKAQAGTPIGALGGASGNITISGIPLTASVRQATLFWSVLTNDDVTTLPTSNVGQSISFNGNPIIGANIGKAAESPCFSQTATIAYKADVTNFVASPGNGVYAVSGFPTSGGAGQNFSEGVTLQVLWTDPNAPLMEDVLYHTVNDGLLAVTQGANTFQQDLSGFQTNASGAVSATLYEVIGNGQANGSETLRFIGPAAGDINLDDTLDGSSVAAAASSCVASPVNPPGCFWDDDVHDVSSQMVNGATTATLLKTAGNDCFDWPALNLLVSTDADRVCSEGGRYVDGQCPSDASYTNHGEYVSCVAHAAEEFLAGLPVDGSCPRTNIQSCIVNPRARSQVGKP